MDAVLTGLVQSAPQLGVGAIVVVLFGRLLGREASAQRRHETELAAVQSRREAAEARGDRLQHRLDEQMDLRRQLQDELAEARRESHRGSP